MILFGTERSPTFLGTVLGLNGKASSDFWNAVPEKTAESTVNLFATVGDSIGALVTPAAGAVSKPVWALAALAGVIGVTAFVFRKPILKALK